MLRRKHNLFISLSFLSCLPLSHYENSELHTNESWLLFVYLRWARDRSAPKWHLFLSFRIQKLCLRTPLSANIFNRHVKKRKTVTIRCIYYTCDVNVWPPYFKIENSIFCKKKKKKRKLLFFCFSSWFYFKNELLKLIFYFTLRNWNIFLFLFQWVWVFILMLFFSSHVFLLSIVVLYSPASHINFYLYRMDMKSFSDFMRFESQTFSAPEYHDMCIPMSLCEMLHRPWEVSFRVLSHLKSLEHWIQCKGYANTYNCLLLRE